MSDWTAFGRIDADGTVFVKTAAGERSVGSWQAGTLEEGLAHFARRFADIATEVDLIETRLGTGAADPGQSLVSLRRIGASLPEANVVGDLDGLGARVEKLIAVADQKAGEAKATRDAARAEALTRRTALVTEAEQLAAESTQWKATGDRLRQILDEWKAIKSSDKRAEAELWKRYSAARDGFTRRRGAHFATLDSSRKAAASQKETLVAEAETLSESSDWNAAAERLKAMMNDWKAAPRGAREAEQKLWERFRAAQDKFFTRRSEVFSARDTESRAAIERRQALVAQAEAIDVDADPKAAQATLREIQGKWHDAGRLPRDAAATLDRRMRAVEDKVRAATDSAWRRTTPDESPLLIQVRGQVAEAEQRLARAEAAGDSKRVKEARDALAAKQRFLELAERTG